MLSIANNVSTACLDTLFWQVFIFINLHHLIKEQIVNYNTLKLLYICFHFLIQYKQELWS